MKRLVILICFCLVSLAANSCIGLSEKDFEEAEKQAGNETSETKQTWKSSKCKIDEVELKTFKIRASQNSGILSNLLFTSDNGVDYKGIVEHYVLKDRKFVVTWDCVAYKVTVDGKEQKPDVDTVDFSSPVTYRFHASDGQYKEMTFAIEQGKTLGLPVIALQTASTTVSTVQSVRGTLRVAGGGAYKMSVTEAYNAYSLDKKTYNVELDERVGLLGMKEGKKWVLVSNAADRTLLRNRVALEIASRTNLAWTPSNSYCELIINNEYAGLYMLAEQICVDKNRVDITEIKTGEQAADTLSGGYILVCGQARDSMFFNTPVRELPVNVISPSVGALNSDRLNYIKSYMKTIEQLLYEKETPDLDYRNYIDIDSFIDAWIVLEVTNCIDAKIPESVWYYKDRGGRLFAGPMWGFEVHTFTMNKSLFLYDYEITDFTSSDRSLWYSRLFMDPEFKAEAKKRWNSYYPSLKTIPDYVIAQADLIKDAVDKNFQIWTLATWNGDESVSWADAVTLLRRFYELRLESLNEIISAW